MNDTTEFIRGHRRTRSLDLTDSLDKLQIRRNRRQKFLENRAKFNQNQGPPAAPPPPIPKSYFTKLSNLNRNSASDLSSSKQSNKNESSSTTSSIIKPSHISSNDEVDVANDPSYSENPQVFTQSSKLIRRFTSDMLNSNVSSVESNSTLTVPEPSGYTSNSTLESQSFFEASIQFKPDKVDGVITEAYNMPPHSTWGSDEPTNEEIGSVTLRRPSDFLKHETDSSVNLQSRHLSLESRATGASNIPQRSSTSSIQMSSPSLHSTRPTVTANVALNLTRAIPFKPPNWVKLPDDNDETDAPRSDYPSWIPVTSNLVETKESAKYSPTYSQTAVGSPLTETSSFQETSLREGRRISTSSEASASSLSYFGGDQKTVSELGRNTTTRSNFVTMRHIKVDDLSNETKTPSTGKITDKWDNPKSPVKRFGSNTLLSSSRRSQTPSVPVKSLVRKFSET